MDVLLPSLFLLAIQLVFLLPFIILIATSIRLTRMIKEDAPTLKPEERQTYRRKVFITIVSPFLPLISQLLFVLMAFGGSQGAVVDVLVMVAFCGGIIFGFIGLISGLSYFKKRRKSLGLQ